MAVIRCSYGWVCVFGFLGLLDSACVFGAREIESIHERSMVALDTMLTESLCVGCWMLSERAL